MAEASQEQNKSEEATPFKLQRAREKGSVARGTDLSFFGGLLALAGFLTIAGEALVGRLAEMMRRALAVGMERAGDPHEATAIVAGSYWPALQAIVLFGGTVVAIVGLLEIIQLRGFVFSAEPLKPDFGRINPAKGFKRLFSMRLVKEALKSVLKMSVYTVVAVLLIRRAIRDHGSAINDAWTLSAALRSSAITMLWTFIAIAFFFAALDQILTRGEFRKQMRMSRRDVTREAKEREGDPRIKSKRKQLHAEFVKRSGGLGALPGSDMLIVNPEHVAVALGYDRAKPGAPVVRAKGRNLHALTLKTLAHRLGIPIFESPALARALYAACEPGREIGQEHYHAVAEYYYKLAEMQMQSADKDPR
ncbi:EscU/YscU/HrcU family type III secretion system export apparatus switch protein [Sphingomonas sp. So64.6b]|uniref:EscU/YscU/HrcU family type III secretion system export apparatus switch protein n=1 Tax=Sphingomonas sp. So64.6b TaxID=2997354 RepID=UPI0015FF89CA|nr:EscU/YscU/HrcU family type III secretion system export apparatus switch protein [Sphingomonas sp. So64.6b]QNA82945.1 EscU/YscU/HrcU family type III secretion system export apparatus switch protein [Sphingomonas sp. So64.6b]